MRRVDALHVDAVWAICCKESLTAMLVAPLLLAQAARGRRVLPPPRTLALLLAVGLVVEIGGNIGCQWAFGVVGLASVISLNVGAMLIASAAMGALLLGEAVSPRTAVSLGLLVLSVVVLSVGAGDVGRCVAADATASAAAAAVALVCFAGVVYAALGAVLRRSLAAAHTWRLSYFSSRSRECSASRPSPFAAWAGGLLPKPPRRSTLGWLSPASATSSASSP